MNNDSEDESSYSSYSNPLWKFSKTSKHRSQEIPNNCWKGFSIKNNLTTSRGNCNNYTPWSGHFRSKQKYTYGSKENHKKFTHRCENCDRGFPSQNSLQKHVSEHEKCPECDYSASSALINLHYRHHHATGLANRIWKKESKEDIEKWIAERKKKYPTIKKIEEEKVKKIEEKPLESSVNNFKKNTRKRKRKPRKQKTYEDKRHQKEAIKSDDPLSKIEISDSEEGEPEEKTLKKAEKLISSPSTKPSALSALQSVYSSNEEDENENKEISAEKQNPKPSTKNLATKTKVTKKHTKFRKPSTKQNMKSLNKGAVPGLRTLRMKRPSLLTMLLESDRKREEQKEA